MGYISAISSLAPRPSLPYCLARPPHQRCSSGTHESPKVTPTYPLSPEQPGHSRWKSDWQKTDGTEDEHTWHGGGGDSGSCMGTSRGCQRQTPGIHTAALDLLCRGSPHLALGWSMFITVQLSADNILISQMLPDFSDDLIICHSINELSYYCLIRLFHPKTM